MQEKLISISVVGLAAIGTPARVLLTYHDNDESNNNNITIMITYSKKTCEEKKLTIYQPSARDSRLLGLIIKIGWTKKNSTQDKLTSLIR